MEIWFAGVHLGITVKGPSLLGMLSTALYYVLCADLKEGALVLTPDLVLFYMSVGSIFFWLLQEFLVGRIRIDAVSP